MLLDEILKILKNKSNKKAYTVNNTSYTYYEFYQYVCNIYNYLIEKHNNAKKVVIYGHKEVYMKAAFLACSFAGKTYIPIDEFMPDVRVQNIIKQLNPDLIIGDLECDSKNLSKSEINNIMLKKDFRDIEKIYLKENDIYYIIFTSGSTGEPKGVKISYKNINSCINWLKEITSVSNSVILNQANYSFDLSVADLYLSLLTESEHFVIESNKLDFCTIFEELKKSNAELAVMTPSFAELLMIDKSFNSNLLPNLKQIVFCGERLLKNTVQKLFERFDDIKIINSYGPTECTFAVTNIEVTKQMCIENDISVGFPKKDVEIFIVDKNLNLLENENIGEILISGTSVGEGYLKEEQNNKKFINYNGKNAYLTGDIGYIKNGRIYYISRNDTQIKYKGYRIELLDIEKNLYDLNLFERVEIVIDEDENKVINKIIAFVKLLKNDKIDSFEIKKLIKEKLPDYMCPVIKIVEEIPINDNGKCDKRELLKRYKNGK